MRMLTFYINREGKNLPANRLKVLENAKELFIKKSWRPKLRKRRQARKVQPAVRFSN